MLTARKRVKPIPAHRLAWRRVSHHSSDHHSSPDSSSSSAPSDHSLSGHTPPDTTDADSSTPQRFVHRSLARTPRHSEAFRRWRSAPLSTPYPSTTSESSLGSSSKRSLDSSLPSFRPSRKRYRSHTASDTGEEHMEVDTTDAEVIAYIGISEGVIAHLEDCVGMGFEIVASDVREDDEEFEVEASVADTREIAVDPLVIGDISESSRGCIPGLKDTIYDLVHYMSEVRIDRIIEIETTQRQLETSQMNMTITRSNMTPEAIEELINRRVEETLATHEVIRAANALEAENQSQNDSVGDNGNGSTRDGENRNGGNGIPNENGRDSKDGTKLWNLTVKNNDLAAYTQRFQELTMMCTKMVPEEEDRVEKFIGGLPDNIQGNVIVAEPTRLQDAVRIANNLKDD
ncbi:hypothetical protein Tco_0945078 [Tanacetum coccineum]